MRREIGVIEDARALIVELWVPIVAARIAAMSSPETGGQVLHDEGENLVAAGFGQSEPRWCRST